jgi:hypothetical protein
MSVPNVCRKSAVPSSSHDAVMARQLPCRASCSSSRPVFFGENGMPTLSYQIDAYHPEWRAGLEVEAGRAWMGNAIYRDLIQALVMVQVDHVVLACRMGIAARAAAVASSARTTRTPARWPVPCMATRG